MIRTPSIAHPTRFFFTTLVLGALLFSSINATAADVIIVNWAGDYVTFDNNLRGYITDEYPVSLDGNENDARSYCTYSDTIPLNPPTQYAGPSPRFYGGVLLLKFNGGPFEKRWAEVWSGSAIAPLDKLYYGVGTNDRRTTGYDFRFWKKEDFLNGASTGAVTFNAASKLEILNYEGGDGVPTNNYGRVRFVVMDGNQFFISQDFGAPSTSSASFVLTNPGGRLWAPYSPSAPYNIQFSAGPAPFAPHTFTNITAVGYYHSNDNSTDPNRKAGFTAARFRVTASVTTGGPSQPPTITSATADPTAGPGPSLAVNFQATATDPENDALTYTWNFGDGTTATGAFVSHAYPRRGLFSARLTVSDGPNQVMSAPINITVGTPPNVQIASPVDQALFRAGDNILFQAAASDPDGPVPAAGFSWMVELLHGTHSHVSATVTGQESGTFLIPVSGHRLDGTTLYRFTVTVTDPDGLRTVRSATLRPDTVNLSFGSNPSGLTLNIDGVPLITPVVNYGIVKNFQLPVSAPSPQSLNGGSYQFVSWSDGQAQTHTVTVPNSGQAFTAQFSTTSPPAATTTTFQILSPADDVNEVAAQYSETASEGWLGTGGSATASYTGLRFQNVTVPRGSVVQSAYVEVHASQTAWLSVGWELSLQDSGNAAAFSTGGRPSGRVQLSQKVQYADNVRWTAGTWYRLPDLAPLLQSVVNRADWTAGNSLAVIARGTVGTFGRKFFYSYDGNPPLSARLVVTYAPASGSALPTVSASINPAVIMRGGSATLSWSTTNATSVTITPSIGQVPASGSLSVSPSASTTYMVSATNSTGTASANAVLTVNPPAPTVTFMANPTSITVGATSTLSWTTTDATSVTINQGIGAVPSAGSRTVSPAVTTTYTLTATNGTGVVNTSATVVVGTSSPVTVTFQIADAANDANEINGGLTTSEPTIWVGNGGSTTTSYAGMRFTNVTIPAGATITSARVEFNSAQDQWITLSLTTRGERAATSAPFGANSRPSQRTLTTTAANHASNVRWLSNTWYSLEEIAAVVQEIVNGAGWQSGNSLSIIIQGTGTGIWGRKLARSYEGGASTAPRLVVTYTAGTQ